MSTINGLTEEQRLDFETLIELANSGQLGLVKTEFDGKPVAVVMTLAHEYPSNEEKMFPLAILVDEDLHNRLTNPFDEGN